MTLILLGVILVTFCCTVKLRSVFAMRAAQQFARVGQVAGAAAKPSESLNEQIIPMSTLGSTYVPAQDPNQRTGSVIGQLRIDSLNLTAPIISGLTDADLARGVGHVPGTSNAGGLGNMVVAGHRDSFFRPLRNITPGMQVLIHSATGSYRYQVDSTRIVTPEQLEIMDVGDRPQLTMITCFPFNYIGAAPKRFIVSAHLVSVAPGP